MVCCCLHKVGASRRHDSPFEQLPYHMINVIAFYEYPDFYAPILLERPRQTEILSIQYTKVHSRRHLPHSAMASVRQQPWQQNPGRFMPEW